MEKKENTFAQYLQLLENRQYRQLRVALSDENEVDIADFIESLPQEKAAMVFRTLPKELAADVFSNLPAETQQVIVGSITDRELGEIVEELFVDDAVDMLEELPANVVKRVLKSARPETRQLINQFLQYPENSVGSIMTAEFIDLKKSMSALDAIERIRRIGEECESIYTCYVTDARRVLEGVVTLRELLLAPDNARVEDLMEGDVITALTTEDQEEAVQQLMKYDFISLPVTDHEHRLVGIVTVDDVMDVMEEEATEDFEKMAAMAPSEKPYLKTGVFTLAKNRILWLLVLMVSGMITGGILGRFESAFAVMPLLVTFIPMLTDTGGNAGSQSSTLIIRGMAVGDIGLRDFLQVFWKELRVSILVGAVLSIVNYVRLVITYPGNNLIALTVALALFVTVIVAKTVGGILPMIAKRLHADPAIMAAPLITTIVDAVSLVIYFSIAQALLRL
ncbi:magnesium transporter [Zongyangia hominis]|uniref:Magnesium transporter MgtE n=1 Tax=Zongyangia hominis TaxID=2763677 RepID=A0A926EB77_9FIRM|nr:magnesium transporter [Zongyangia hominis]MBC8569858.1 magnesium transporter [Zongyangia hominis]